MEAKSDLHKISEVHLKFLQIILLYKYCNGVNR
jgi:hypothetical protein